jgi:hypothetical protein
VTFSRRYAREAAWRRIWKRRRWLSLKMAAMATNARPYTQASGHSKADGDFKNRVNHIYLAEIYNTVSVHNFKDK